jgi:hypothetical protein
MPIEKNLKLIPLRKFIKKGLYSQAYLSVIAKRGRLKTKKIGRNYFTTEEWFDEYLSRHAREEKAVLGTDFIKNHNAENILKEAKKPALAEYGFFHMKKFKIIFQASVVFTALLLINFLANMLLGIAFPDKEKGMVLGAEEEVISPTLNTVQPITSYYK